MYCTYYCPETPSKTTDKPRLGHNTGLGTMRSTRRAHRKSA